MLNIIDGFSHVKALRNDDVIFLSVALSVVTICCRYSSANAYMLMYRQIDPMRNKRKYV